ncbi:hypothetical protein J1605_017289 [Eschrichtius robustus]|uniref:Uncharacterized protein n=1 Tax=Eschrichtius robustus TaxID=9764 RepID=A0AB34I2V3_ESCRO|nr:hypothetical protein J1605_017289 [Eschrichtius robustus]
MAHTGEGHRPAMAGGTQARVSAEWSAQPPTFRLLWSRGRLRKSEEPLPELESLSLRGGFAELPPKALPDHIMDQTDVPPDLSQLRVAGVRGAGRFGISIQHMQGRVKEAWSVGQSPGPSLPLPPPPSPFTVERTPPPALGRGASLVSVASSLCGGEAGQKGPGHLRGPMARDAAPWAAAEARSGWRGDLEHRAGSLLLPKASAGPSADVVNSRLIPALAWHRERWR